MLRATAVTLTLSVADLEEALTGFSTGSLQDLRVELETGALILRLRVAVEAVRMSVPIELRFSVLAAAGSLIKLGVTWTNMGLLPGFVKEKALQKAFEALPGEYQDGV